MLSRGHTVRAGAHQKFVDFFPGDEVWERGMANGKEGEEIKGEETGAGIKNLAECRDCKYSKIKCIFTRITEQIPMDSSGLVLLSFIFE